MRRIKLFLNNLVGAQQFTFIPGRHITDNVLLRQDLLRGYHRGDGVPRCAMNINIQKAYDYIDWGFLKEVLVAMNFPFLMIDWLMECVTTTSYSISFNGCLEGFLEVLKG